MKFIFNDEKKSVILETPKGKKITVDEDAGVIKLEDENANEMTMNKDGIKLKSCKDIILEASSGDIKMEGINLEMKAQASLKAEGSASAEVKASGSLILKGATVMIN